LHQSPRADFYSASPVRLQFSVSGFQFSVFSFRPAWPGEGGQIALQLSALSAMLALTALSAMSAFRLAQPRLCHLR
jgi:hypothetical protein